MRSQFSSSSNVAAALHLQATMRTVCGMVVEIVLPPHPPSATPPTPHPTPPPVNVRRHWVPRLGWPQGGMASEVTVHKSWVCRLGHKPWVPWLCHKVEWPARSLHTHWVPLGHSVAGHVRSFFTGPEVVGQVIVRRCRVPRLGHKVERPATSLITGPGVAG